MSEADRSEKITINLGPVDLGQIDLLVREGFYTNRTDFIRTAIRTQLATQAAAIEQTVARRTLVLGIQHFSRADLEQIRAAGRDGADPGSRAGHASPTTYHPSSPRKPSPRSRCWARSAPAPQ